MRTGNYLKLLTLALLAVIWAGIQPSSVSQAMPVFMDLYDADPAAKSDLKGKCAICHVSEDSGVRTDFGKAFIKSGYRITADLRKSFTDIFVQAGDAGKSMVAAVEFDSKKFFETNCAACHGNDGKGVAPGAPDFTERSWHQSNASDERLGEAIKAGRGIMPPFKDRLSGDQLKVMVSYVRTFSGS